MATLLTSIRRNGIYHNVQVADTLGDSSMNGKKTLGEHIEDGLTFLGDGIHRAVIESKDHELESIKLGLLTDQEKLRMLKQDLYRAARANGEMERVVKLEIAIKSIEASRNAQYTRDNDFIGKFNQIVSASVVLLFFATLISYFALGACGNSKKPICNSSTQIARYFNQQFSDPK